MDGNTQCIEVFGRVLFYSTHDVNVKKSTNCNDNNGTYIYELIHKLLCIYSLFSRNYLTDLLQMTEYPEASLNYEC